MTQKKLIIFMPSIENGGVEKNLFLITNHLSKNITKTILITSSKKSNNRFKNIEIITPKINTDKIRGRKLKYLLCIFELFKILLKEKNLVLFAFQANLYCALLGLFFPRVKIITRSNSSPSGWSKNFVKKFIFLILFKRIDRIIVNSKDFKKELKKKFRVNSVCIYNPLNKEFINRCAKAKVNFNFFEDKNLKIINIGRLVDQKDQITLLKALNLIKKKINFKALIMGSGERKKNLMKYIVKNNLERKVKIIDFKDNPFTYLNKADVMVHTAKFEGLPNVLLEALSLKKFIIATNCPTGPSEILSRGKGGDLVKIGDYKKIAFRLIKFNNKKNKKKINFGYKMLKRFDFKKNQDEYLKLLKKYLNSK